MQRRSNFQSEENLASCTFADSPQAQCSSRWAWGPQTSWPQGGGSGVVGEEALVRDVMGQVKLRQLSTPAKSRRAKYISQPNLSALSCGGTEEGAGLGVVYENAPITRVYRSTEDLLDHSGSGWRSKATRRVSAEPGLGPHFKELAWMKREIEVDIPAIDPSLPYKEPPCPLDRKASVRMSFRVPKKSSSGKESKYEYLRRKLSLRPPRATQIVGDVRSKGGAFDGTARRGSTQYQNQLAVYPETGERTLPPSGAKRGHTKNSQQGSVLNKQKLSENHQFNSGRGALSQPTPPQDLAPKANCTRRNSSTRRRSHSQSPLISSLASSPPQSSYYSQLQLPQNSNGQRRSTSWHRVASASVPSSSTVNGPAAPTRGYTRVMSNCQPSQSQSRPPLPNNVITAPHVVREESVREQRRPSSEQQQQQSEGPHGRGRRTSGTSSQAESSKSRRRHRSQSPANILSRSHNEYRYEQSKVRSQSTDRLLNEVQESRQEKKRANSVDFDVLTSVDNTCCYPNSPRPHRTAHGHLLSSQRRGGSTYTTGTSSYAHLGRKKQNKPESSMSQSAETLNTPADLPEAKIYSTTEEGSSLYGLHPLLVQSKKDSPLTTSLNDGRNPRQARVSADSGYTSPSDHETSPKSLTTREKMSPSKHFTPSLSEPAHNKEGNSVRFTMPREAMQTHW